MWLRRVRRATHAHPPADIAGSLAGLSGVLLPRLLFGEKVQETDISYIQTLSPKPYIGTSQTHREEFWSAGWMWGVGALGDVCLHHLSRGKRLPTSK